MTFNNNKRVNRSDTHHCKSEKSKYVGGSETVQKKSDISLVMNLIKIQIKIEILIIIHLMQKIRIISGNLIIIIIMHKDQISEIILIIKILEITQIQIIISYDQILIMVIII
jgi:hypothetical protein